MNDEGITAGDFAQIMKYGSLSILLLIIALIIIAVICHRKDNARENLTKGKK